MPYSGINDSKLPPDVKAASEAQRRRFVSAFNSAYADCEGDDCEGQAMRIARASMDSKKTLEDYLKTLDDIKDDLKALPSCERCGTVLNEGAKSLAGMQLCGDCNDELTKAVIVENKEVLRKHFGGKGLLDRLFGVKTHSERGFKILAGNKWVAWYTNARMDLEKEKFAYDGLVRDVKRQNETGDYPELWFFHIAGTKHGRATQSFVSGGR